MAEGTALQPPTPVIDFVQANPFVCSLTGSSTGGIRYCSSYNPFLCRRGSSVGPLGCYTWEHLAKRYLHEKPNETILGVPFSSDFNCVGFGTTNTNIPIVEFNKIQWATLCTPTPPAMTECAVEPDTIVINHNINGVANGDRAVGHGKVKCNRQITVNLELLPSRIVFTSGLTTNLSIEKKAGTVTGELPFDIISLLAGTADAGQYEGSSILRVTFQ